MFYFTYQPVQLTIQQIITLIAGILIGIAQLTYIIDVFRRKVTPSVLSWSGWALLMGAGFVSLFMEKGWQSSLTGLLISVVGCATIALTGLILKNYSLIKSDWKFLIAGSVCMVFYLVTENATATTLFAITADFILAIPTFKKAWNNPESEKTNSWIFGFTSWSLTLLISLNHDWLHVAWTLYLFAFNATMLWLSFFRKPKYRVS
ncbi:MAG: hypothetical protein IPN54_08070 [Bacteroidetes bacterium]|nr:hypothetical protein [Bacteroidota bacterium]